MAGERVDAELCCHECGEAIADPSQGVAFLAQAEMRGYRERQQQLEQLQHDRIRAGGRGLMSYDEVALTEKASWRLAHRVCLDEDREPVAYTIDAGELTSPETALDWLCHLMEQEWPAVETDFAVFLRRHFLDAGSRPWGRPPP